jgi:hypothetical protein
VINFIETLFGIAIATALVGLGLLIARRRPMARRMGTIALVSGALGGLLELYVRYGT